MLETQKNINNQFVMTFATLIFFVVLVVVAFQQYFNIGIFQHSSELICSVSPLNQVREWLIWGAFAIPLWIYVKWLVKQDQFCNSLIIKTIAVFVAISLCVILSICLIEILISGSKIHSILVWRDFLIFYMFQNGPIYTFGYTIFGAVLYVHLKNKHLTAQSPKLAELYPEDANGLKKIQVRESQSTSVLKIKVGNTYKIVAVENIDWIEADDYCVNIHTNSNDKIYSMRTSLKSLESLLPCSFLRVHRSAIVNMAEVKEYKTQGAGTVKMKSGDEIPVAKSKIKVVNGFFNPENV